MDAISGKGEEVSGEVILEEGGRGSPLGVFEVAAKVGRVVDFVFEHLSRKEGRVSNGKKSSIITSQNFRTVQLSQRCWYEDKRRGMTHDTGNLIPNKIRRLHRIIARHQKIMLQTPRQNRQHQIAPPLHRSITRRAAPHLETVGEHDVFGGRFLVL